MTFLYFNSNKLYILSLVMYVYICIVLNQNPLIIVNNITKIGEFNKKNFFYTILAVIKIDSKLIFQRLYDYHN